MRLAAFFIGTLLSTLLWGSDLIIPWVANKDAQWGSEIVLNNSLDQDLEITLEAVRQDGTHEIEMAVVPANGQLVLSAGATFTNLGSGSGYTVFVRSESDQLTGAVRVASLDTASGFSPSMGPAIPLNQTATTLIYPAMPADGFSAPVFVNPNDTSLTVTVSAFTAAGKFGDDVEIVIEANRPKADLVTNLIPGLTENAYLIARAESPFLGANFSFNGVGEPSMVAAIASSDADSSLIDPLLSILDTSATLSSGYADATSGVIAKQRGKEGTCPSIDVSIDLLNATNFLDASLDWGSGCTNTFGVYHAGSMSLDLGRQGAWMSGTYVLNNFVTRFQGADATIDGTVVAQGSTASDNFSLSGSWDINATIPIYQISGQANASVSLNLNQVDDQYQVYGSLEVEVVNAFPYWISARVEASDPLVYDYAACIWPIDGRLTITALYGIIRYDASLDFGTGNCATATLTLEGNSTEISLNDIYN